MVLPLTWVLSIEHSIGFANILVQLLYLFAVLPLTWVLSIEQLTDRVCNSPGATLVAMYICETEEALEKNSGRERESEQTRERKRQRAICVLTNHYMV